MNEFTIPPALYVYSLFVVVLSVLLIGIDSGGGVARAKSKTALNEEDTSTVAKGAKLVDADPDGVARVMRAHRNALANVVPFLLITLMWVLMGATPKHVLWVCSAFTGLRLVHAIAYVSAKQPWRTVSFTLGQLVTAAVAVRVVIVCVQVIGAVGIY